MLTQVELAHTPTSTIMPLPITIAVQKRVYIHLMITILARLAKPAPEHVNIRINPPIHSKRKTYSHCQCISPDRFAMQSFRLMDRCDVSPATSHSAIRSQ